MTAASSTDDTLTGGSDAHEWLTVGTTTATTPRVVVPNDRVRRGGHCYVMQRLAPRSYINVREEAVAVRQSVRVLVHREPNP